MSLTNIESDYTPKDFLEKLLGKSLKSESQAREVPITQVQTSNSQSTIEDVANAQIFSPRSTVTKRIHFQSVQNIRSPHKQQSDPVKQEHKPSYQFKENIRKMPLRKQPPQNLYTKDQNPQFESLANIQPRCHSNNYTQKLQKPHYSIETEQKLILHKTKLILQSVLKNKVQDYQIQEILSSLQKGIQNPAQFDQLITSSKFTENPHSTQKINQRMPRIQSCSLECFRKFIYLNQRRAKSSQKYQSQKLNKKQKKKLQHQSRKQILKSIKKMKQLLFLNQKSLKRSRR